MELPHTSPSSHTERYVLNGSDEITRFTVGRNVVLNVEPEHVPRERDSARANSRVIADYKWETKSTYSGRILSVRDKVVAYRLFNENTGEAVRVLERENRARHLIKDFRNSVIDLQWALHAPILAVLDANANLYLYQVDEACSAVTKFLNVIRGEGAADGHSPKFTWCPYIYDEEENDGQQQYLLAVANGKKVDLFAPHVIKEKVGRMEVKYSDLSSIAGAVISFETEHDVTAIRMSADATAVAVSTVDGATAFYVLDGDHFRKAQERTLLPNQYVEDLVFLDNLTQKKEDGLDHWKHMIVGSDNGRRLTLFDCESWECLGRLRFESPTQINRLEMSIEPSGRFVFVADYDASNLFCIEIYRDVSGPRFASCTQVTFCNPLVCIVPTGLAENLEMVDLSLDDEEGTSNAILASFIAITNRSLLELSVDLELSHMELLSGFLRCAEDVGSSLNISTNSAPKAHTKNHSPRAGSAVTKLLEAIEERFSLMNHRMDELSTQLDHSQQESETQLKRVADAVEKLTSDVQQRNVQLAESMSSLKDGLREELQSAVENGLNTATTNLQVTSSAANEVIAETVRSSVHQVLIPAVENLCTQLFQQLNESFRDGLQDFLDQLHRVQSTAPTPVLPDYSTLTQLIEAKQYTQAFEMVLARHDPSLLTFVCSKVDPDVLFSGTAVPLPVPLLLTLVQQLSQSLDRDTDMRFRYIENVLLALETPGSPVPRSDQFRAVLQQLGQALNLFMALDVNAAYKRQTRMINQLILNLLR
ncbi:Protein Y44E3A.6 a [Aphelenchoides avenae]|nr:Protein Y44E3A.6 a [Aphelenchus avenae]